jgi:signal transduction histidine kinase
LSESLLRSAIETVFTQHAPLILALTPQEPPSHEPRQPLTLLFAELVVSETEPSLIAMMVSEEKRLSFGQPTAQAKEASGEPMASSDEQIGSRPESLRLVNAQLQNKVALLQATLGQAEQLSKQLQLANEELQAFNEELQVISEEFEVEKLEEETTSRELQVRLQEQIQARQQFEELNRLKDSFISIASHEIKTPLTSIMGNVQLALKHLSHLVPEGVTSPREQQLIQQALERCQRNSRRLTRLVNDLLAASRLPEHSLQLRFDHCDFPALVREIVEEQRQLTPDRQLALSLPEYPIKVLADPDRIGQVVTNYLSNALKYSPSNRMVRVILREEDQVVRLQVSDQGPGISLPEQERVWERFYRVPGIAVQNGSGIGLGLGLAICRFIIEEHGGQVGVESLPGQGATFWFTLPTTRQEKEDGVASRGVVMAAEVAEMNR